MELVLGLIFWGLIIYYFVKRSRRKKREKLMLLESMKSDTTIQQSAINQETKPKKQKNRKKFNIILFAFIIGIAMLFIFVEKPDEIEKSLQANTTGSEPTKNISANIFKENDTSFSSRKRIQVDVYAPEAITKLQREQVLKNIAQRYVDQGYDYTQVYLRPTSEANYNANFGSLGFIEVIPDGCGVSGKDCGGDKIKIKVSDYVLKANDQKYMDSFVKNHKAILYDFNQDPDNWTQEKANELEQQFNEAIAKDLGVNPDDVPVFMVF